MEELDRARLKEVVQFIRSHVPQVVASRLEPELAVIESYIINARPARIALVGRRGSGKSSLVNAIFGEPRAETGAVLATTPAGTWYQYEGSGGALEVLDTRGLGEGGRPEGASDEDAVAANLKAVRERCPDAILFVIKAADVDVWIHEDLAQVAALRDAIARRHGARPPVIGVLTQVDLLSPADVASPPYDDPEKQANIALAKEKLSERMAELLEQPVRVFATSAYMRYRDGELVVDRRWQIDELVSYLVETLPNEAQLTMGRVAGVRSAQMKIADALIQSTASAAAAVAATPIPLADMPILTAMQVLMVTGIAYLAGRRLSREGAMEFIGALGVNVGAGFALREVARGLSKWLVPGGGSLVSAGVAYWGTYGLGQAAVAYYIENQPIAAARKLLEQGREKANSLRKP